MTPGSSRPTSTGSVAGLERVWAAGDGTNFPIKQGGLAAQQADAAASSIAALAGAGIAPEPFRPVLRGVLMTGEAPQFMSSDIAGGGGEGQAAAHSLWWPPVKIAGRYLAPYLGARDPDLAIGAPGHRGERRGRRRGRGWPGPGRCLVIDTVSSAPPPAHLGGDHLDTPVRDVMSPGVLSVVEDASLRQVLRRSAGTTSTPSSSAGARAERRSAG